MEIHIIRHPHPGFVAGRWIADSTGLGRRLRSSVPFTSADDTP